MKKEYAELVKYRIEKAKITLMDAKEFFKGVSLESTVNRIYYAMFYAVNALLITKGLFSSKHSGVRALFDKEFVKKGIVKKESGRFYSEMLDRRLKGDYKDFVMFEEKDVKVWIEKAEEFIKEIENLLRKEYPDES